jgi:hypothetical protein
MVSQVAIENAQLGLIRDEAGRYRLPCRKASLVIRMKDAQTPVRFRMRDEVGFRITACELLVEELKTGDVRMKIEWGQVESLAVGEPESDNTPLFQG